MDRDISPPSCSSCRSFGSQIRKRTAEDRFIRTEQGLLIRTLQKEDSRVYLCHAVEHGFIQTLLRVTLQIIDTERLEALLHKEEKGEGLRARETPGQKVWYRDFMSLINHPDLNSVDEFCEQVWRQKNQGAPAHAKKWKHLQEQEDPRAGEGTAERLKGRAGTGRSGPVRLQKGLPLSGLPHEDTQLETNASVLDT